MKVVLSGASGEYFDLSDKLKKKLKNNIVKYLLSCEIDDSEFRMDIKVDDGFGIIATEACLEYVKLTGISNYRIVFFCVYREEFTELPDEIKQYYADKIEFLKAQGLNKYGGIAHVTDDTRGWGSRDANITDYKNSFTNCCCRHIYSKDSLITYLDKKGKRDKLLYRILDSFDVTETKKGIVDLYAASNSLYDNSEYAGVRKQKNSSKYYYRINIKLPDGIPVNIEKGSFFTAEEANKARREHLISLTTQDCENADKTVDEVFNEFICVTCKDKASLEKKYLSYYSSRIKDTLGNLKIGETQAELNRLYTILTNYQVKDNRSKDSRVTLSKGYVSGLRAMLCNLFDYAYNMKYINSHPMYALPSKWWREVSVKPEIKLSSKKQGYIEPFIAYSGNKYKLLPDIFKLFPKNIEELNFIDLFGGAATVSINVKAKRILINESNKFLVGIYKALSVTPPKDAWSLVQGIIDKYGLNATDESAFKKCRDEYNEIPYEERVEKYWYWGVALVYHSFNTSTVNHNESYGFNSSFGRQKVNVKRAKEKFLSFAKKLYEDDYSFHTNHYKYMTREGMERNEIFFYADPPYYASTASYNKFWGEEDEYELYEFLESCHRQGIKWMLSNVTHNNGKENPILIEWIEKIKVKYKGVFHIYYLNRDYSRSSYNRKDAGETVEIAITNYE